MCFIAEEDSGGRTTKARAIVRRTRSGLVAADQPLVACNTMPNREMLLESHKYPILLNVLYISFMLFFANTIATHQVFHLLCLIFVPNRVPACIVMVG